MQFHIERGGAMILDILGTAMNEWHKKETKLIIWGNLGTACKIAKFLKRNGILFDGFAVNRMYYAESEHILMGQKVYCLEEYLMDHVCSLIIGFSGYRNNMLDRLNKSNIKKIYLYDFLEIFALDADNTIDKRYMEENREILQDLRKMLADEKSKIALDDFLDQKLTGAYSKRYEATEGVAISDKRGDAYWSDDTGQSSRIVDVSNRHVKVKTIDEIASGKEVTFIKMDIEGAELRGILGGIR